MAEVIHEAKLGPVGVRISDCIKRLDGGSGETHIGKLAL